MTHGRSGHNWKLFPIYGLKIVGPCYGVEDPIWKDATLISRETLISKLKTAGHSDKAISLASGGDIAAITGYKPDIPPTLWLSHDPHVFIAVRRSDAADAMRYAKAIRAFLTASMWIHGNVRSGFAMYPHSLHIAAASRSIEINCTHDKASKGITYNPAECSYGMQGADHIIKKPVLIRKDKLQKSWSHGYPICTECPKWHIYRESEVARILIDSVGKRTPLQHGLHDVAVNLADSTETVDYHQVLVSSVAAMEQTLKPKNGLPQLKLKQIIQTFFQGREQAERIESIIAWRNDIAHESKQGDLIELATYALLYAWTLWHSIAGLSATLAKREQISEYLNRRVVGLQLAAEFDALGKGDLATELRTAVYNPKLGVESGPAPKA